MFSDSKFNVLTSNLADLKLIQIQFKLRLKEEGLYKQNKKKLE